MVAHAGKIAGAAESAPGLEPPVCRISFGQMRGREHVFGGPEPFQDRAAVDFLPFSLELDGARGGVPAGDSLRIGYFIVEIAHRHDAGDAFAPERIHQGAEPAHRGLPARFRAFSYLRRVVIHQHRETLLPFAENAQEDVSRGHDGPGAVVKRAGFGGCETEAAPAVEQGAVYPPVVGRVVMHYGIVEFVERGGRQERLQDGAVAHFREGHDVGQAAVGVGGEKDGLGHRVAFDAEAGTAPAFSLRPPRGEEIFHVPEHDGKRAVRDRQGAVCPSGRRKCTDYRQQHTLHGSNIAGMFFYVFQKQTILFVYLTKTEKYGVSLQKVRAPLRLKYCRRNRQNGEKDLRK